MPSETTSHWVLLALQRYEQPLLRYASAIVGSAGATDVVQDTFMRLCKQDRESVEPKLAAWLFTVCRNRALEVRRDKTRLQSVAEVDDVMQSDLPGPGEALERKEAMRRVLDALDTLPERQRIPASWLALGLLHAMQKPHNSHTNAARVVWVSAKIPRT